MMADAPRHSPLVALDSVHARDVAGPKGRARGSLLGIHLSLGPSVYAFVGAPEDGTLALAEVLTGTRAPLRGRVLVSGRFPARSYEARRRIGSLLGEPSLPDARTVEASIALALEARGEVGTPAARVLEPFGLGNLAQREPRSLSYAETRAVELSLALSTKSPALVVLYEPLADVAINLLGLVRERIREIARAGACVVLITSSPADARALADRTFVLHKGLILGEDDAAQPLPGGEPAVVAWVRPADDPSSLAPVRALSRLLADRAEVRAVSWNEGPAGTQRAAELRIVGEDLDACALALVDAAAEASVVIEAIAPASPGITQVRAATEALLAFRRSPAYRPPPPPMHPASPMPAMQAEPSAPHPPAPAAEPVQEPDPSLDKPAQVEPTQGESEEPKEDA